MKRLILVSFLLHIAFVFPAETAQDGIETEQQLLVKSLPSEIQTKIELRIKIDNIFDTSKSIEETTKALRELRISSKIHKNLFDIETPKLIQKLARRFKIAPYMAALYLCTEQAMNKFEQYLKKSSDSAKEIIIQQALSEFSNPRAIDRIFKCVANTLDRFCTNETALLINLGNSLRWQEDSRSFIHRDSRGTVIIPLPAINKGSFHALGATGARNLAFAFFAEQSQNNREQKLTIYLIDLQANDIKTLVTMNPKEMAAAQLHPYRGFATPDYGFIYGSFTLKHKTYWHIMRISRNTLESIFVTK